MFATITSYPMAAPSLASLSNAPQKVITQMEIEFAKCECCGLSEECTSAYIKKVRDRYNGKWICGLCSEAVKDEALRSGRLLSNEEALNMHMNFRKKVRAPPHADSTKLWISTMKQALKRSLDSPQAMRSSPSSPTSDDEKMPNPRLSRSGSCFAALPR